MIKVIIPLLLISILIACKSDKQDVPTQKTISKEFYYSDFQIADTISFADQVIPLNDVDLKERFEKELIVNAYYHSSTFFVLKRSTRWFPIIEKILKEEGIPDDFKYLAVAESGLTQARSYAGALGFWQFLKNTAKEIGLEVNRFIDERLHVEKSTRAACKYLKNAKEKLGSWVLAAAAYNRGVKGISDNLEAQFTDNFFDLNLNTETARYLFRILALKEIISHPEVYSFKIDRYYQSYKTDEILVTTDIKDLSLWAINKGFNKKILKKLNPWLISNKLKVEEGKSYVILLPSKEANLNVYGKSKGK